MNDALIDAITRLGCIPLKRYCQITGEQPNAVYLRRHRGVWVVGREIFKPEGSDWWVDLVAVAAWVKGERPLPALIKDRIVADLLAAGTPQAPSSSRTPHPDPAAPAEPAIGAAPPDARADQT